MSNLNLQGERRRSYIIAPAAADADDAADGGCDQIVRVCCSSTAADGGSATVILTASGHVAALDDNRDNVLWSTRLDAGNNSSSGWFDMTCVDDVYVCLNRKGAIVCVRPSSSSSIGELVGEFENGIHAAQWSPNKEILVLITTVVDDDKSTTTTVLLTMNSSFDVLNEAPIETSAAASGGISIAWNASSTMIAVSSLVVIKGGGGDNGDEIGPESAARQIRWYKADTLQLQGVGRTEDGSGKLAPNLQDTPIAWAGSGCSNLLATVQRKGKKTTHVAFFEPNGLRHREFVLRNGDDAAGSDHVRVTGLRWNASSDLLAVTLQGSETAKVQLWYRSNYHWYLKYEFRYSRVSSVHVQFHDDDPFRMYVFMPDVRWIEYKLRWETTIAASSSTAYVVDGCLLNSTDFAKSFVPPPMYAQTLPMPAPICQVASSRSGGCRVVVLSTSELVVLENDGPRTVQRWEHDENLEPKSLRNLVVVQVTGKEITMLAIGTSWENPGQDFLVTVLVSSGEASIIASLALEERCINMTSWVDSDAGVLLQLEDGSLLEYEDGNLAPCAGEPLIEPCPWMAAVKDVGALPSHHRQRLVLGMSSRHRLYCHDFLLSDSVSSFSLSLQNNFLCYVTSGARCVLRFLALTDLFKFDPLAGSDENHFVMDGFEPRHVERGARLVAVLWQKPAVVLQMPRGNLEIIYPRALVLRHAMLATQKQNFKDAFELMRRQKVDLNLLVDMDPNRFLNIDGITQFVEQVVPIDHLNLFISCLQNWNSTEERYKIPHWIQRTSTAENIETHFDFTTKVNQVCRKMRQALLSAEREGKTSGGREILEGHFLLPILSTFAKEDPPQLHSALEMIRGNAMKKHLGPSKKPPLFSDTAQSSIQYLAFLADYELLFQTALESYDYDMARAIARNSQMDPKVYLPLLKRCKELPLYFGRYEVDVRLKRYESALRNLSLSGSFGESWTEESTDDAVPSTNSFDSCMNLIEGYGLYRLGLELFDDYEKRNRIMNALSDHLMQSKNAKEALCVCLATEQRDDQRCIRAAKAARDWSVLFSFLDKTEWTSVANEIAEGLAFSSEGSSDRNKSLEDAARVLLDYGNDVSAAVDMLVRAEAWVEAKRIGDLHSRDDLSRSVVEAAVIFAHTKIEDFGDRNDAFLNASTRYSEVLNIRKEAIRADDVQFGELANHDDAGSLFSVTSIASNLSTTSASSMGSVGSLSSVISVKSTTSFSISGGDDVYRHKSKYNQVGRERKKKERKRRNRVSKKVRPGSEEDLQGLVQTMKNNCVDERRSRQIGETIIFLVYNRQLNVARALYDGYVHLCKCVDEEQQTRIETTEREENLAILQARKDGLTMIERIRHPVETEVNALRCKSLCETVHSILSYLPTI
jgi:elongator complex protein 1